MAAAASAARAVARFAWEWRMTFLQRALILRKGMLFAGM